MFLALFTLFKYLSCAPLPQNGDRLIQDAHMAENGYFGQIAPTPKEKGPREPLVNHIKPKKLVRKVKKNLF